MSKETIVECIVSVLEASANQDYIGEKVSQLEHALQCAKLAADAQASDEVVLAALLHDIGHFCEDPSTQVKMDEYGVALHEKIGADFLRKNGFPEKICDLVEGHVQAKRYLVQSNPPYSKNLSHASQETLKRQGGPMSPTEAENFKKDPLFKAKLQLRAWDEQGKKVGWKVPDLDHYKKLMLKIVKTK